MATGLTLLIVDDDAADRKLVRRMLRTSHPGAHVHDASGADEAFDIDEGEIDAVLLELSLVPLYQGEPPAEEVLAWARARGFVPAYIAPAFVSRPSRQWLQADVLLTRDGDRPVG